MYTTQMEAARKGIVTEQMKAVADYEKLPVETVLGLLAKGQAVIPANKNHACLAPFGISKAFRTKINVNLGTSRDCLDMDIEMEKVMAARCV